VDVEGRMKETKEDKKIQPAHFCPCGRETQPGHFLCDFCTEEKERDIRERAFDVSVRGFY